MALDKMLVIGAALFCCGLYTILTRRNAVAVLMGGELGLNAANINFVALSHPGSAPPSPPPPLPLLAFFVNIAVGKRLPRKGDWVSLGTIGAGLVMSIVIFFEVFRIYDPNFRYPVVVPWLSLGGRFGIHAGILGDNLTAVMLVVVTGVSAPGHIFSGGYM